MHIKAGQSADAVSAAIGHRIKTMKQAIVQWLTATQVNLHLAKIVKRKQMHRIADPPKSTVQNAQVVRKKNRVVWTRAKKATGLRKVSEPAANRTWYLTDSVTKENYLCIDYFNARWHIKGTIQHHYYGQEYEFRIDERAKQWARQWFDTNRELFPQSYTMVNKNDGTRDSVIN